MNTNEGTVDRLIRIAVGLVLAILMLTGVVSGLLGWVFLVLGGVLAVTGAVGFCPLYALFGVRTCRVNT